MFVLYHSILENEIMTAEAIHEEIEEGGGSFWMHNLGLNACPIRTPTTIPSLDEIQEAMSRKLQKTLKS